MIHGIKIVETKCIMLQVLMQRKKHVQWISALGNLVSLGHLKCLSFPNVLMRVLQKTGIALSWFGLPIIIKISTFMD